MATIRITASQILKLIPAANTAPIMSAFSRADTPDASPQQEGGINAMPLIATPQKQKQRELWAYKHISDNNHAYILRIAPDPNLFDAWAVKISRIEKRSRIIHCQNAPSRHDLNQAQADLDAFAHEYGLLPCCRKCGCTDLDCSGCIARTGEPCYWIEPGLCSACFTLSKQSVSRVALSERSEHAPSLRWVEGSAASIKSITHKRSIP